jgi:hypothetical protein
MAIGAAEGYEGDIIPASWDDSDYIIAEVAEIAEEANDGINDDINEEGGDDEDGFAMADVGE